jgi:serine phosphatase RsbU (regulator of sigma subunit)
MHGKFVGLLAQRPWLRLVAWNLAVTVTYVLAGLLSFVFGLPPAYISPVYPPSGIAVAAFLILGPPVLPGIWLANVLSSAVIFTEGSLTPATAAVTMAGGFGAVGEALVAGWVMQRFTGARHPFEHPRHVVAFQLGAALLAGAVGAALGTFSIWAAGFVSTPDVWHTAVVWWLGDAAGIAIFAPLILAWWRGDDRLERVDLARSVPLIVAATLIVAAAEFVSGLTVEYLYLPVVLWGAFRSGPRGATLAAALVSVMTVLLTAHRLGSSSGHSTTDALMLLESFVAVITSTGLIVCAIRARQETAEAALAEHNRTLEQRVAERTAELALKNRLLGEKQDRIDADLGTALALQAGILPSDFARFTSVRIAAAARPALEMSGDFYDVFHVAEGRLAVVIADVSGKGVAAAFFMAMARTLVRTIAASRDTPAALIAAVNDEICRENPLTMFVTLFYAEMDEATGELACVNAGHCRPVLLRDGEAMAMPSTGDMALGIMSGVVFREQRIVLRPGDAIFVYTDGVTEAADTDGHLYGEERLVRALGDHAAEEPVESVFASLEAFSAGAPQADDITCLTIFRPAYVAAVQCEVPPGRSSCIPPG